MLCSLACDSVLNRISMMSHVQTPSFEKSDHCYWMLPSTILLGGNYLTVDGSKSLTWRLLHVGHSSSVSKWGADLEG